MAIFGGRVKKKWRGKFSGFPGQSRTYVQEMMEGCERFQAMNLAFLANQGWRLVR